MGIAVDFPTILAVICVLTVMMAADSKSVDSDDYSSRRSSRRYKETKGLLATEEKSEENTTKKPLQKPQFRKDLLRGVKNGIVKRMEVVGQEIRVNCGARGYPKPSLKVYKDGNRLNGTQTGIELRKKMFRISSPKKQDSGIYKCVAKNDAGIATLIFNITVESSEDGDKQRDPRFPHWTKPKQMIKQLHAEPAGNTVVFKCIAGGENLTTLWYKNSKLINSSRDNNNPARFSGYKFRHDEMVISLEQVVLYDIGKYTCNISNSLGYINHTYELDVTERSAHRPILHFVQPTNQTVFVGDNVTMKCTVYSDAHPFIYWKKYIYRANKTSSPTMQLGDNMTTSIIIKETTMDTNDSCVYNWVNVTLADSGMYAVDVSNHMGSRFYKFSINVTDPVEEEEVELGFGRWVWILAGVLFIAVVASLNVLYWSVKSRHSAHIRPLPLLLLSNKVMFLKSSELLCNASNASTTSTFSTASATEADTVP